MMFLILSGVILAAGILYWFWSHIQLTQKKVQLLENAVFELRGMVGRGPDTVVGAPSGTVYRDLDDDDWTEPKTEIKAAPMVGPNAMTSTPIELLDNNINNVISNERIPDDLRPGGRLEPIAESNVELVETSVKSPGANEQFRELFFNQEAAPTKVEQAPAPAPAPDQSQGQTLEGMPLKELRRLASDRGIAHTSDMRKKELIAALRNTVTKVDEPVKADEPVKTDDAVTEVDTLD